MNPPRRPNRAVTDERIDQTGLATLSVVVFIPLAGVFFVLFFVSKTRLGWFWLAAAILLLLGAAAEGARLMGLRRDGGKPSGRCRACGYDLRATPDRCPECGAVPAGRVDERQAAETPG